MLAKISPVSFTNEETLLIIIMSTCILSTNIKNKKAFQSDAYRSLVTVVGVCPGGVQPLPPLNRMTDRQV